MKNFSKGVREANIENISLITEPVLPEVTSKMDLGRKPVKLNLKQGLTMNQILDVYALKNSKNNLCRNHSYEFAAALRAFEPWALKMFDSSSKIQSGILYGNLFEFGNYKQCISIYSNSQFGPIRGKHCSLKVYPDTFLLKKILSYKNISERRWDKVKIFVENATLDWSVCVPDSCGVNDVLPHFQKLIKGLTEGLNISVGLNEMNCLTQADIKDFTNTELLVIGGLIVYILMVAIFTLMDFYTPKEKAEQRPLLRIFSVKRHARNILAKNTKGPSDLDCVHGIRFMSTCYVIIGHRYLMMMFFPVINSLHIMDWILYYRSTAITGGTLCVDTFFMVSGMLVSVGFFEESSKNRVNWFMFYFYRYMRITPPLAIVVLWYCTLMHHFGSGPLWNDMLEVIQKPCQEYWWATIMHIQNYVHPYPLCLTQAWYLTCDMQYYFLSPLILVPLLNNDVLGYVNFIGFYLVSVSISFYLAWINKYNGGVPVTNQLFSTKYFQHHYITPHVRASTYIIGLGFGLVVFKQKGTHIKLATSVAVAGWMVCIATMLASLVGCHVFFLEEHDYNRIESSIYLAISRTTWTLGIVWMVWACINGYGGPINYVLSLHVFRVFGKISYGMYLLHMGMQYMMSGAAKMHGYFSDFSSLYAAFSDLFIMVIAGFIFTILFEAPLIQSLSLLTKKRKTVKATVKVQPLEKF
ncbi:nose resistant to fluoxetine protein 6-like [Anthonomus grandis grandis]|uniref:nose resistant to fluoxetine protein 6-like n=1 Tax=Anthonomus grandis grandis TaxID=2921223 RepID=UPI0021659D21|nr:nose resistant to fluoxetine protein 6-like [Anthonomus grandis grandis]